MVEPGDEAGKCVRCGETTTAIGHGHSVVAVWCDGDGGCGLITSITQDATTVHADTDDDSHLWTLAGGPGGPTHEVDDGGGPA